MLLPMMGLFLTLGNMMPPLRLERRGVVEPPAPAAGAGVTVTVLPLVVALLGLRATGPLVSPLGTTSTFSNRIFARAHKQHNTFANKTKSQQQLIIKRKQKLSK